jgi:tetratricopeptide (TPR) repeat protein
LRQQQRWEAALEANERARRLDPTRVGAIGQRADIFLAMGQPEQVLPLAEQGLALQASGYAAWLLLCRCRANLALGQYDDAIVACEKAAALDDSGAPPWSPHVYLAAAYALQGNDGRAQAEKTKLLMQRPGFSIAAFKALRISDTPAYVQQTERHLYPGLRKAGIPEQ